MTGLIITAIISLSITCGFLLRGVRTPVLSHKGPAFSAIFIMLLVTAILFWHTTGIRQVIEWQDAVVKAPSLLAPNVNLDDSQQRNVALALRTRLQDDPLNAHGWELLGRMQEKIGNNTEALAAFYRAWKLEPSAIDISLKYSAALIQTGVASNIEQATAILTQLLSNDRDNIQIMSQLAYAALSKHDSRDATQWFRRILLQLPAKDKRREFIQSMISSLDRAK